MGNLPVSCQATASYPAAIRADRFALLSFTAASIRDTLSLLVSSRGLLTSPYFKHPRPSPLSLSPWGYWRLNEASGAATAYDCRHYFVFRVDSLLFPQLFEPQQSGWPSVSEPAALSRSPWRRPADHLRAPTRRSGNSRAASYSGSITAASGGRGTAFLAATQAPLFSGGKVALPTIPASSSGGPLAQSWSMETWMTYSSAPSDHARVFELGTSSSTELIYLHYNSDYSPALFEVGVYQGGSRVSYAACSSSSMPAVGTWFHLVLTVSYSSGSGYTVAFYINGASASGGTWSKSLGPNDVLRPSSLLGASANWGSTLTSASLAEVVRRTGNRTLRDCSFLASCARASGSRRHLAPVFQAIYGYALSASQVSNHYQLGLYPCSAGAAYPNLVLSGLPW